MTESTMDIDTPSAETKAPQECGGGGGGGGGCGFWWVALSSFFLKVFFFFSSPQATQGKDEELQRTRMVLAFDNHLGNAKVTNQPPPR